MSDLLNDVYKCNSEMYCIVKRLIVPIRRYHIDT